MSGKSKLYFIFQQIKACQIVSFFVEISSYLVCYIAGIAVSYWGRVNASESIKHNNVC